MFEPVLTMTHYWDGPRGGIAMFRGKPHVYELDDETNAFALRAIDEETLLFALEDWAIWERWQAAWKSGGTPIGTHPALAEDRARHDDLAPIIDRRIEALPGPIIRAYGEFRSRGDQLEVEWSPLEVGDQERDQSE